MSKNKDTLFFVSGIAENKIIFKTSKMQRGIFHYSMKKHIVGVILFHPDKKPLILYGVFTDSDILDKIKLFRQESPAKKSKINIGRH
jgi:hypothetical protein